MTDTGDAALRATFDAARRAGYLARRADIDAELAHAREFGIVASGLDSRRVADLGSGAGLPGLVLAMTWRTTRVTLIEASSERVGFLERQVVALGLAERVEVIHARVEDVARRSDHRGCYDVVTARSFGPPAVVAECGAALLRPRGMLVVSEPPAADGDERWPPDELARLGLGPAEPHANRWRFVVIRCLAPAPDAVPRRAGQPAKRPRW